LAFPVPEVSNEAQALSDTVRTLSISDVKEQPLNYMDPEIQTLVNGFIKAKLDAVKGTDTSFKWSTFIVSVKNLLLNK
jgi:hypothetical protein